MKKMRKRLFGTILAMVMLASMVPNGFFKATAIGAVAQNDYVTGDIIEFGSYPQTKVTDSGLLDALNLLTPDADNNVTYNGSKYKRVFFTEYTPYYYGYPATTDYTYQIENGYEINTVYWFKYEPLQWRVLSNISGELFVMAEKILDSKAYNQADTGVTWETGTLRSWLNNDFYNAAFNPTEKAGIITSTVINPNNPFYGTSGGNNTSDKLFLLSIAEAMDPAYGFSNYTFADPAREAQGTDFSKSDGLYISSGNSRWWFRSPGNLNVFAGYSYYDGNIHEYTYAYNTSIGIRPVLKMSLPIITSNITFDAAGGSGGSSTSMSAGEPLTAPTVKRAGYTFMGWLPEIPATVPETDTTYTAQWISNSVTTGDIITFGSYPQPEVVDASLLAVLNGLAPDANGDVTFSGSRYKRVYFTEYTPAYTGGPSGLNLGYQDKNGYFTDTVYWFKYEPISWRVLSNTNGELFVLAEKALVSRAYHQTDTAVTWETCDMRVWLNNNFYSDAFSPSEKTYIVTSTVITEDNPTSGMDGGNTTTDKLFIPSYAEVTNPAYGFSASNTNNAARRAKGTSFAKSNGLSVNTDDDTSVYYGNSCWWLRTPGMNQSSAIFIEYRGYLNTSTYYVNMTSVGVKPVMRLTLPQEAIEAKAGSTCVVNHETKVITGLIPGLTQSQFESNYVQVKSGYSPEYSSTLGTGSVVNVRDNNSNEVVGSYTIIIFGDVNGDGNITGIDAGIMVNVENYMTAWDQVTDAATIKAADVNGDGNVTGIDAGIVVDVENYMRSINQSTGLAS